MFALVGVGCDCKKASVPSVPGELTKIRLQTDWYPQPEHGGFYQALACGYYKEVGLEVEILTGGPGAGTIEKVVTGRVDFSMHRADAVLTKVAEGLPLEIVMATLQHDPQGIMLHAENPINSLAELDGKTIMAVPGMSWIAYLEKRYGIHIHITPSDYGLERFMADKQFIQQCMVTNEPYYARLHGQEVKVLPLRESGFDPYHVVYGRRDFIQKHRDMVKRFRAASIRGWTAFLKNPEPALALIKERNPGMEDAFMHAVYATLVAEKLVDGDPAQGESVGDVKPARIQAVSDAMSALQLLARPVKAAEVYAEGQ
ncbi:MAG: ABC transporter substrate-binding protein [Verrucomicrobiota bacterium]|nr:ABC transporter substrate-binding protein [Verrucomicrobiota bacterium]